MKKAFAIALLMILVVVSAFAAKGDIMVGAQLGYACSFVRMKTSINIPELGKETDTTTLSNAGFGFAAVAQYAVTDEVAARVEFGLDVPGKKENWKDIHKYDGGSDSDSGSYDVDEPVRFSAFLGGLYAFEISKEIKIAAGAGLDMAIGKTSKADDAKTNCSIGVGAEVIGSYSINKQLDVNIGARYSFYFIDTDENLKEVRKYYRDNGGSYTETALRIFAGATYKI